MSVITPKFLPADPLIPVFLSQFRRTTPGSLQWWNSPVTNIELLDESHPATLLLPKTAAFPRFSNVDMTIRAFPKAVMVAPTLKWPDPPYNYVANPTWSERLEEILKKSNGEVADANTELSDSKMDVVNMSLSFVVGKKSVHKSAVIRRTIVRRLKKAISLIVTRGAEVERIGDAKAARLIINDDANIDPHQWIEPSTLSHIHYPNSSHPF